MKTLQKILATILLGAACSSCDLTLIPEDTVTPQTFFKTETDLRLWTNQFYTMLESPDNAAGLNADDMVDKSMGDVISGTRMASNEKGWTWTALRKINYYLANSHNCTDEAVRTKYDGVAYFFRAYFYYEKVLRYGDVPWYEQVIGSEEEELLKKPREDRGIIMDHVMNDLKNAIEMLPREKDVARVTRWSALALKSRIALYEGTWRKYRNLPDADKYLQLAADAASTFISESGYSLYKEGTEPYRDLFCSDDAKQEEVILARIYNFEGLNLSHNVQFNIRNSAAGFTRRFMNHYLMADGSRFTEKEGHETMSYTEETAGRDPRMAQTVLCPGYIAKGEESVTANDMTAMTGYEPIKFVSTAAHSGASKGTSDWPLFRTAEVYLNYAEAKAELGTLTKDDLLISIDRIRDRAGMKGLDMAAANANPDPFLLACYPNVTKSENSHPRNPSGAHDRTRDGRAAHVGHVPLERGCATGQRNQPLLRNLFLRTGTLRHGRRRQERPRTLCRQADQQSGRRIDGTAHHSLRHGGKPRLRGGVEYAEIHLERGTRLPVAHSGRPARTDGRTADPESRMDRQHRFRLTLSQPDKIKRQ